MASKQGICAVLHLLTSVLRVPSSVAESTNTALSRSGLAGKIPLTFLGLKTYHVCCVTVFTEAAMRLVERSSAPQPLFFRMPPEPNFKGMHMKRIRSIA
jgi:hypothetical protein